MIDAEFDVYDTVSDELRLKYGTGIFITGEYIDAPSRFPATSIIEVDNSVYRKMTTREQIENAASIAYEVNVYSNKVGYKKMEAKQIMNVIDEVFASMNFTRTMLQPASNIQDATIYRLVARYEAVVDRDLWLYTG